MAKSVITVIETEVLIIGSGGAGLQAAISARDAGADVIVLSKGEFGLDGATVAAEADMAIDSASCLKEFDLPGDASDSPDAFLKDMVIEGEYLNDQDLVRRHVEDAPVRLRDLISWGVVPRDLVKTPGHSYPRGVWIPGYKLANILRRQVVKRQIPIREHTWVTRLVKKDGVVQGALAIDALSGSQIFYKALAVILCTGGAARMYPYATSSVFLTGDGMAMAYDAGAKLVDMEFPMFLPYTMLSPLAGRGIPFTHDVTNYLNAWALNREGFRYMIQWDPLRMERTTRDVNAVAAGMEILEGRASPSGGTWLSLAHLPANLIEHAGEWFPEALRGWKYGRIDLRTMLPDLSKDAVETIPAAHFFNGGIWIDEDGWTGVPGLFAAGEGTAGIHGANRISGNAITQIFVWGARAGKGAAKWVNEATAVHLDMNLIEGLAQLDRSFIERDDGITPSDLRKSLHETAWRNVGLVRSEEGLKKAVKEIAELVSLASKQRTSDKRRIFNNEWRKAIENCNMAQILLLVAQAALMRKESRGAHYRLDHPRTDDRSWLVRMAFRKCTNGPETLQMPVKFPFVSPERKTLRPYGQKGRLYGKPQRN